MSRAALQRSGCISLCLFSAPGDDAPITVDCSFHGLYFRVSFHGGGMIPDTPLFVVSGLKQKTFSTVEFLNESPCILKQSDLKKEK